ncbi:MAG: ABC transporter ATP-binding protein [Acidimicrobiia bacterium]
MSEREPSISVKDVTKVYDPSPAWMKFLVRTNVTSSVVALDGISFEVGPGEICAVVGPNGAGKTTTFRILVGLTTPTTGTATVTGYDAEHEPVAVRRMVGWMPGQDVSLLGRLTCTENLQFHGRLQGMKGPELKSRISDTLAKVGLAHAADHSGFALSSGMRARLQLARALLHRPKVLILDEPTGAIDPVAAHELLRLIIDIVEEDRLACLISSHRLEEIEALHSHVVLLDKGRVRYDGDLDELRSIVDRQQFEIRFATLDAADHARQMVKDAGLGETTMSEDGLVLSLVGSSQMRAGTVLTALKPMLEEVVEVAETQRPLRDILADMYREEPTT